MCYHCIFYFNLTDFFQMISNFDSMCKNTSKCFTVCFMGVGDQVEKWHSFQKKSIFCHQSMLKHGKVFIT